MTAPESKAEGSAVVPAAPTAAARMDAVVEVYEGIFASIPEAGDEGATAILEQILRADAPDALDAPWRSTGLEPFVDQRLIVRGIRKAASEFAGGLPWFLILDCVDPATGETISTTTGAVAVVAQLVRAFGMGWLPLEVVVRRASRPSKSGYYPMHLEVVRA